MGYFPHIIKQHGHFPLSSSTFSKSLLKLSLEQFKTKNYCITQEGFGVLTVGSEEDRGLDGSGGAPAQHTHSRCIGSLTVKLERKIYETRLPDDRWLVVDNCGNGVEQWCVPQADQLLRC